MNEYCLVDEMLVRDGEIVIDRLTPFSTTSAKQYFKKTTKKKSFPNWKLKLTELSYIAFDENNPNDFYQIKIKKIKHNEQNGF